MQCGKLLHLRVRRRSEPAVSYERDMPHWSVGQWPSPLFFDGRHVMSRDAGGGSRRELFRDGLLVLVGVRHGVRVHELQARPRFAHLHGRSDVALSSNHARLSGGDAAGGLTMHD